MKSPFLLFAAWRARHPDIRVRHLVLLAGACVLSQGCERSPTEPPPPVFLTAQLDAMWVDPFHGAFQDGGVFVVMGAPTDTAFRLPENARLRVQVETSGGDSEEFAFQRFICPGDRDCTGLGVAMEDGHHANELRSVLDGLTARVYSVSVSGRYAGIRVFDMRAVAPTLELLSRNNDVSIVSQTVVGVILHGPPLRYSQVLASLPLDYQATKQGDGVIQSGSGQTITVRYAQPDGTNLLVSHVLP